MSLYRFACCLSFFVLSTVVVADSPFRTDLPQVSWDKAAEHYGQECIVTGTVVNARDIGKRCFLNFNEDYRNSFTTVIEQANYSKFPAPPDKLYLGQFVRVVGKVIEFKGKPEIVITGPEQIEVVADPNAPAGATPAAAAGPAATAAPAPTAAPTPAPAATPAPAVADAKGTPAPPVAASGVVKIATFNVLNLFDAYDDPYVENENPAKNPDEVARLAALLRRIGADVVALEEVENRGVVQQFVDQHLADFKYEVVFFEGNSDRGIDVALLSRLPVREVTSHRHFDFKAASGEPMRFQRDLLQVHLAPEGFLPFDVFVVHLKSKYGGEEASLPLRLGEAQVIRGLFDSVLRYDSQARFVICGDFNDTLESKPVQAILGDGAYGLRKFVDELPEDQRITYNREPHRSMIDFIFASPAMGANYVKGSYGVLDGTVETNGSDHNPVFAAFRLTPGSGSR